MNISSSGSTKQLLSWLYFPDPEKDSVVTDVQKCVLRKDWEELRILLSKNDPNTLMFSEC